MGFDLVGIAAVSKRGEYFRNNVWWWRGLWAFVCGYCGQNLLTKGDQTHGGFNDCHIIDEKKAKKIAKRLEKLLKDGTVKNWSLRWAADIRDAKRNNQGKTCSDPHYDWATEYPFSIQNVKDFAAFCKDSGGFKIC